MSEFLKFAFEVLSQVVYNIVTWLVAFAKVFVTGWFEYFVIFKTYFPTLSIVGKVLSVLLMILLAAIPIVIILLLIRRAILNYQLKADKSDNAALYREIGRLNKQVLDLMEEKNSILALKVNAMGGTERIPYMGASALTDDVIPSVGNVTDPGKAVQGAAAKAGAAAIISGTDDPKKAPVVRAVVSSDPGETVEHRFPKLTLVDQKYAAFQYPQYNNDITLEEFVEGYRLFAASQMKLYYTPEIIRRFVAGMAASKLLILEGISGTGKTSLPYSFSRYMENPATIVSVQPSYRDRTEILGYFNEFSKRFNETEFLRALYEANYRPDPTLIVLDEMNLARIEYYFAEMLSVLEMPNEDEWVLDLVPTAWEGDPVKMEGGKIHVSTATWFVGTANNDDSTFTITDKVYDRAMPINIDTKGVAFDAPLTDSVYISYKHFEYILNAAKVQFVVSEENLKKIALLDDYVIEHFRIAFGNRIVKQLRDFVPAYVGTGGTELDGLDYVLARKVFRKFESLNLSYIRDEIDGLCAYIDELFGEENMTESKDYLRMLKKLV